MGRPKSTKNTNKEKAFSVLKGGDVPVGSVAPAQPEEVKAFNWPGRAPARFTLQIEPDETGIRFGSMKGVFVYRFPQDNYAGGADHQECLIDENLRLQLASIYQMAMEPFIGKHATCSVDHAVETLKHEKALADALALAKLPTEKPAKPPISIS